MKTVASDTVLSAKEISVSVGSVKILQNVTLSACNGDILAVMGPTGSGKTTLLNTIAGRQPLSAGNIYLSGKQFDKGLRRRLGYVVQHDAFFSNLTLWETLYFTAMVRLPERLPKADKLKRISDIIDLLQLKKCKNTAIGDSFHKGLSGGEKKRVSIASTLLTDPDIILLDEPTSGLDSTMALQIVKQLKTLASEYRKTVILTIHQPSSEVYNIFDSLLLLAHGKVVYYGGAHSDPLTFLERSGYTYDPLYNPADFMMNVLRSDESTLNQLVKNREDSEKEVINRQTLEPILLDGSRTTLTSFRYSTNSLISTTTADNEVTERWPTGFTMQLRMLTWRSFKQSKKMFLDIYIIILYAFVGVVAGLLMSGNVKAFRDTMGIVFYMVALWSYDAVLQSSAVFPTEIEVISRERASGAYRLSAFYLSKLLSELPLSITVPTLFYTATYWIARLSGVREFFITWSIVLLDVVSTQGIGLLVSVFLPERRPCFAVVYGILNYSLLFCGYIVQDIPSWLVWAKYFSHMHYSISAMTIILYEDTKPVSCNDTSVAKMAKCLQNSTDYVTSEDILHDAGIELPVYCYVGTIALTCMVLRISVYLALRLKRPQIS